MIQTLPFKQQLMPSLPSYPCYMLTIVWIVLVAEWQVFAPPSATYTLG